MNRWRSLYVSVSFMLIAALLGCPETPKQLSPPVFTGDANMIRSRILSPRGSLQRLTLEDASEALAVGLSMESPPVLVTDELIDVMLVSDANLRMDTKSLALEYETPDVEVGRVQHPITAEASIDGWIELTILCGENPSNHSFVDGVIDAVMLYTPGADDSDGPTSIAWGEARNCALWDQDVPTRVNGTFAILFGWSDPRLANNDAVPIFYEFVGTQETAVLETLNIAGFYAGAEAGWTQGIGNQDFIVGGGDTSLFVHDCSGRWQCSVSPLSCTFLTSNNALVAPTCSRPSVEFVSW